MTSDLPVELPPRKNFLYRILRHPLAMPYNRLALFMVGLNFLIYLKFLDFDLSLETAQVQQKILSMVIFNFAVALLIRQELVINFLFSLATRVPRTWPLGFRWACGKIYHFGGVHVGCFFSATLWFALFTSGLMATPDPLKPPAVTILCQIHLFILTLMMVSALPVLRAKYHNAFEIIARFGGWCSLGLFWSQTFAFAFFQNLHPWQTLFSSPSFWVLGLLTFSVCLPWFYLKKVPVQFVRPSNHVVLAHFQYGVTPFSGSSTSLSRNPWLEWHSFANVPSPGKEGFRLTISRAGDWTGRLIEDLPEKIWVKGIPTAGVGNIETIFNKVIWLATGSGIGPCLPHLLAKKVPAQLVWSTRDPRKTYGDALVNEIQEVQPNALIWDTTKQGKPDLVALAYKAYRDFGAEAIICISNKKVTWEVVHAFESRGIPAFGAIWDS